MLFAGGTHFAQARAFSEEIDEFLAFLAEFPKREPLPDNDSPGKQGKEQEQQKDDHRKTAHTRQHSKEGTSEWGGFLCL